MSDTQYETYQHYGTNAERLAFVPDPPAAVGVQPIYIWYETDTGSSFVYDSTWHALAGAGGGLPATMQGDMLYASAANTVVALAKNASATRYLSNTGASNNPAWAQVALATGVLGTLPVANGGTGVTDAGIMRLASVTVTNAQVLTLPTTPVQIIAAPGANLRTMIHQAYLLADFAAGAYTGASATLSHLSLTNSSYIANDSGTTPALAYLSAFLDGTKKNCVLVPWIDTSEAAAGWGALTYVVSGAVHANAAVNLVCDNGGVDFGGGNAANTLKVAVYYSVHATV